MPEKKHIIVYAPELDNIESQFKDWMAAEASLNVAGTPANPVGTTEKQVRDHANQGSNFLKNWTQQLINTVRAAKGWD